MKKLILDIETSGLNFKKDKIIEICCIELRNLKLTNNIFHSYINPEIEIMNNEAYIIHGININFLKKKPKFNEISSNFIKFIYNSEIIVHNSKFDINFINFELKKNKKFKNIKNYIKKITDTLIISNKLFKKKNSLDNLCKKFKIDLLNKRNIHSAIIDVKLLYELYIKLINFNKLII